MIQKEDQVLGVDLHQALGRDFPIVSFRDFEALKGKPIGVAMANRQSAIIGVAAQRRPNS